MIVNNSFDGEGHAYEESEVFIPRSVRFTFLLVLEISSIYLSLILIFHLLVIKTLRSQLTNHVMIILLIIGLNILIIDIPFHLSFLRLGVVHPSIPSICLLWWLIDTGLCNGCTIIMAWGSFEQYLLIFYDRLFLNARKRFISHYLPFIALLSYIVVFYITVIIFPPCNNTYDYTLPVCNNFPCYMNVPVLGIWDSIVNSIIPTMIISIASVTLIIRVHCQKRRLHQANIWRKQRKMAIQLLSNSVLYLIPNIPFNILLFIHLCGVSKMTAVQPQLYFDFLCYFIVLLYPFVCLGSLSELRKKIPWKRLLLLQRPQQNGTVRPQ